MNIEFKICATLDEFNTLHDAGEIQDSWVVLIEDQPALWTNGKLLPSPYTKEQLESLFVTIASKGIANGIASLNENGKIPESQLPSYVDDVLEFENLAAFPTVGESGKIYVAIDTNLTYRWSGSTYVEISPSIALGETESTAYMGLLGARTTTLVNNLSVNRFVDGTGRAKYNQDNNTIEFSIIARNDDTFVSREKGLIVPLYGADGKGYGTMSPYNYNKISTITQFVSQIPSISRTPDDLGLIQVKGTVGSGGEFVFDTTDTTRIPAANPQTAGVMTAADKVFLNSLSAGAGIKVDGHNLLIHGSSGNDFGTTENNICVAGNNNQVHSLFGGNLTGNTLICGDNNDIDSYRSIVFGSNNAGFLYNGIVVGNNNKQMSSGNLLGNGLSSNLANSTIIGTYNSMNREQNAEKIKFAVGIGSNDNDKKTAFQITDTGNIFFGDDSENKENKFYDATTKKINESFLPDSVPTTTGFTSMQVVSALPADPDPNTLYIVTA